MTKGYTDEDIEKQLSKMTEIATSSRLLYDDGREFVDAEKMLKEMRENRIPGWVIRFDQTDPPATTYFLTFGYADKNVIIRETGTATCGFSFNTAKSARDFFDKHLETWDLPGDSVSIMNSITEKFDQVFER